MKLNIKYIDNHIEFKNDKIPSIEIENKKYFYRLVKDLYSIYQGNIIEDIMLLDDHNQEINIVNKLKIFINFFDFDLDTKKYTNDLAKYISKTMSDENKNLLLNQYKKIANIYKRILNEIDLPLYINSDVSIENITKFMKININIKNDLLENIFMLIDLENVFQTHNILVLINIKQYLSKQELEELYKYAIYNQVKLLLIDSQSYGTTLKNENKLIIDKSLDEFML